MSPIRAAVPRVHTAPCGEAELVEVGGAWVSSVVRTVVDVARFGSTRAGVVVLDQALRAGISGAALEEAVRRLCSVPGSRRARVALGLADDGAESPWESWTRVRAMAAGLPRPTTQLEIATDIGVFYADLAWPELRLIVEFDGQLKYRDLAGADPAGVVIAEKEREDAIRAEGWSVVRVTANQLRTPDLFEARLRRALGVKARRALTPRPSLLVTR
ncbi:hypothetical protein ACTVCO_04170 [Sanguibacter sp. A247]|uniref:hypothetical protein n=1 Tax=unclassified Sanguibacter TaxID=2645534 RepID=UPI003FD732C8